MAPKSAKTGANRQTGDLNSWLKPSTRSTNSQSKRPRSNSSEVDNSKIQDKRQKPSDKKTKEKSSLKGTSQNGPQQPSEAPITTSKTLTLTNHIGDIFAAPRSALLIHACNCDASWSAGIAAVFKKHYPGAFKVYAAHCRAHSKNPRELVGTALLIPPQDQNEGTVSRRGGAPRIEGNGNGQGGGSGNGQGGGHFVGCLFTSAHYGKRRDAPEEILEATGPAVRDLLRQVGEWNATCEKDGEGEKVGEVRMCKINSGLFGVAWEQSREVLEGIDASESGLEGLGVQVWEREE